MTFFLDVALRSSAPILVALLACVFLRRRSAALRHSVLAAAVIVSAAIVPLSVALPSWEVRLPAAAYRSGAAYRADASQSDAVHPGWPQATSETTVGDVTVVAPTAAAPSAGATAMERVFLVWMLGVVVGATMLLIAVARLVRMTRRAEALVDGHWRRLADDIAVRYRVRRPIVLLATRASGVLATWGWVRPRVLLPAHARRWNEARARAALCHELAHIRRCDWAVQMAAELLRVVCWFNPLVWLLCARLRREAEYACDDAVLEAGIPATVYASHLVEIARACRRPAPEWMPALSVARPSTLEGRVTAMLNARLNRQAPTWRAVAVTLVLLAGIAIPIASFEVAAQGVGPGALAGYVYDSSGGVLPGVEVTLVGGREGKRSAVSDGSGRFQFTAVGAGEYALEVTLPGFRTLRNEVVLASPKDWTRNITLQVGELQETIRVTGKRPAQPVAAAPAARNSGPVRVGGNIKQPTKTKTANPIYPEAMQAAGIEGVVPMDALIAADGKVASVRVLSAEVHPELARAAEEAVRQWEFTPTLLNNVPVAVEMTVSISFSLED